MTGQIQVDLDGAKNLNAAGTPAEDLHTAEFADGDVAVDLIVEEVVDQADQVDQVVGD